MVFKGTGYVSCHADLAAVVFSFVFLLLKAVR